MSLLKFSAAFWRCRFKTNKQTTKKQLQLLLFQLGFSRDEVQCIRGGVGRVITFLSVALSLSSSLQQSRRLDRGRLMSCKSGRNSLIRGRTDLRDTVLITHPRHTNNTIICQTKYFVVSCWSCTCSYFSSTAIRSNTRCALQLLNPISHIWRLQFFTLGRYKRRVAGIYCPRTTLPFRHTHAGYSRPRNETSLPDFDSDFCFR